MQKLLTLGLLAVMTSGCAIATQPNFDTSALRPNASTQIASDLANEEIVLEFVASQGGAAAAAQYGALGALVGAIVDAGINNSRAKSAEERIAPFRIATSNIDVRKELTDNLEIQKNSLSWADVVTIVNGGAPDRKVTTDYLKTIDAPYFVQITTSFHLKPALQVVELKAHYSIWDTKRLIKNKKTQKPFYTNNVTYQSFPFNADKRLLTESEKEAELAAFKAKYPIDDSVSKTVKARNAKKFNSLKAKIDTKTIPTESYTEEGSIWLENDGERLQVALKEGSAEVARIIVGDLSGNLALPEPAFDKKKRSHSYVLETKEDGRILERFIYGGFVSRMQDYPLISIFN